MERKVMSEFRTLDEINKEYSQMITELGIAVNRQEEAEQEAGNLKYNRIPALKNRIKELKEEAKLLSIKDK